MSSELVIRHVLIRGRVQGVGFRAWVEDTAIDLGLRGWVRNRRDGSVEAVLAGELELVLTMIEASRRGPPAARVERLDVSNASPELLGDARPGFWVLPTA
jgi:acylphosphatase